jgi:DNA-binding CsgD family transcriptional regulator
MVAFLTVRALARDLSAAARLRDIGEALLAASENFGLPHVIVAESPTAQDAPMATIFSSVPDVAFDQLSRHPLVEQARQTEVPFCLAEAFRQSGVSAATWASGLPGGFETFHGAVIPVHDGGRLAWWVCFAGEQPIAQRSTMCMLAAASYAAHARAMELASRSGKQHVLTPREIACLRRAASGRSDPDIARELGISGRTVRFHIDNAKEKLGVRTRMQAVARILDWA